MKVTIQKKWEKSIIYNNKFYGLEGKIIGFSECIIFEEDDKLYTISVVE